MNWRGYVVSSSSYPTSVRHTTQAGETWRDSVHGVPDDLDGFPGIQECTPCLQYSCRRRMFPTTSVLVLPELTCLLYSQTAMEGVSETWEIHRILNLCRGPFPLRSGTQLTLRRGSRTILPHNFIFRSTPCLLFLSR